MQIVWRNRANPQISGKCLHALQVATGFEQGALSPNLRSFAWPMTKPSSRRRSGDPTSALKLYPFMSLFLGQRVEEMSGIDFRVSLHSTASVYQNTERLRSLKKVTIASGMIEGPSFAAEYVNAFRWTHLETLTLDSIAPETVKHLASMPNLKNLKICDEAGRLSEVAPKTSVESFFGSLQELTVTTKAFSGIAALLDYISLPNKIKILRLAALDEATLKDARTFVESIPQRFNPLFLQSLEIADNLDCNAMAIVPESELEMEPIDELDICPLLAFEKLELLALVLTVPAKISPRDVSRMTTAWRKLHTLKLLPTMTSYGRLPLINHSHILALVAALPQLRCLGLRFDTTQIREQEHWEPVAAYQLASLLVGESPICSSSRVAVFLDNKFPSLARLDADYVDLNKEVTWEAKRWKEVKGQLKLD